MTLWELAAKIFDAAESMEIPHMAVGAIAVGAHGIPRATRDIDLLVSIDSQRGVHQLIRRLESFIEFEPQAQFDTITWGCRHVGIARTPPPFKVERFEMFDDPFVISEFARKIKAYVPMLARELWLQSAEDLVVQKLRWARPKDLEDALDVVAVQTPANLDMAYIRHWCSIHGTTGRLETLLASLPPL
jgi:hypothetical protein